MPRRKTKRKPEIRSRYKGVSSQSGGKTWTATICPGPDCPVHTDSARKLRLGTFFSEEHAAHATDVARCLITGGIPYSEIQLPALLTPEVVADLANIDIEFKLEEWRMAGSKPFAHGSSLFRGVSSYETEGGEMGFQANIHIPGTEKNNTVYQYLLKDDPDAERTCAEEYDKQALIYYQSKAKLNSSASKYLDPKYSTFVRKAAADHITANAAADRKALLKYGRYAMLNCPITDYVSDEDAKVREAAVAYIFAQTPAGKQAAADERAAAVAAARDAIAAARAAYEDSLRGPLTKSSQWPEDIVRKYDAAVAALGLGTTAKPILEHMENNGLEKGRVTYGSVHTKYKNDRNKGKRLLR